MKTRLLVLAMAAALIVVACGGGDDSTTTADGRSGDQFAPGAPAATPAPAPTAAPAAVGSAGLPAPRGALAVLREIEETGRKVIETVALTLVVDDVEAGLDRIQAIADGLGGFVEHLNSSGSAEDRRGNVTLRVPPDQFSTAIERIEELGDVISREVGREDVSEQFIDLEARLKSALSEEESLLRLLQRTQNVTEILTIERELTRVRSDIERLQGQLNLLDRRVSLATIRVFLSQPTTASGEPPDASYTVEVDDVPAAADGIKALVSQLEGILHRSSVSSTDGNDRAVLTVSVLRSDFDRFIGAIEDLGEVKRKSVTESVFSPTDARPRHPDARVELRIEEEDAAFPAWAIALIVIGSVAALGAAVTAIVIAGRRSSRSS